MEFGFLSLMLYVQIVCWGVRNMSKFDLLSVKSPSVEITIGDATFQSNVIANVEKNPNFEQPLVFRDLVRTSSKRSYTVGFCEF